MHVDSVHAHSKYLLSIYELHCRLALEAGALISRFAVFADGHVTVKGATDVILGSLCLGHALLQALRPSTPGSDDGAEDDAGGRCIQLVFHSPWINLSILM